MVGVKQAALTTYRDEQGRELFDLPDSALPSEEMPAPVRFLPMFDNLVLAHDDRRRLIADQYRPIVFPGKSMVHATYLVDGFVRGIWKIEGKKPQTKLVIEPFEPLSETMQNEVMQEGERLMRWMWDDKGFEIQLSVNK